MNESLGVVLSLFCLNVFAVYNLPVLFSLSLLSRVKEPTWPATARVCPRTGSPVSQTHVTERTGVSSIHWRPGHCVILTSSHTTPPQLPRPPLSPLPHILSGNAREISPHLKLCCHSTTLVPLIPKIGFANDEIMCFFTEIRAQKTCFIS